MCLTDKGQVGRYPAENWEPGGIQGRNCVTGRTTMSLDTRH